MTTHTLFRSGLVAMILGAFANVTVAQTPAMPPKEKFHLFLLVGQSNMAGRGTVEPQDKIPDSRVLMLNKAGEWVPAVDPIHYDKPTAGVGPGRSFALAVADASPGITIGLIPCAVGGSPIDAWQPGAFYEPTNSHPWDDAIKRAQLAMQAGTLKGILWHQGESDSTVELAPSYEAKLDDLVARFRAGLAALDVPFIAGQLGNFPDNPWDDAKRCVDQAHRDLPLKVAHAAFVSSDGLTKKEGDDVHFSAQACREFGRRYADTFLKMTRANSAGH